MSRVSRSSEPGKALVSLSLERFAATFATPWISGVCFVLLGEEIAAESLPLPHRIAILSVVRWGYVPLVDEPRSVKRFESGCAACKRNGSRWISRWKACRSKSGTRHDFPLR